MEVPRRSVAPVATALVVIATAAAPVAAGAQVTKLTTSPSAEFGNSVALDGDLAAVGHQAIDDHRGKVHVFRRGSPGEPWIEEAQLRGPADESQPTFGWVVRLDGERLVVGAPKVDAAGIEDSGTVFLYERDPASGEWLEIDTLSASDAAPLDALGWDVDLDGDVAVAAAPGADPPAVYVYERRAEGDWAEATKLLTPDPVDDFGFGADLAVDGDTLLVGGGDSEFIGPSASGAWVYERNPDGSWSEGLDITPAEIVDEDLFGLAVTLDGDRAAVAATFADNQAEDSGAVYVFERDAGGPDQWGLAARLDTPVDEPNYGFGNSVALDGELLAVGVREDGEGAARSGAVYLFEHRDGAWVEILKFVPSDASFQAWMGEDVSLSGEDFLASARFDRAFEGAAYLVESEACDIGLTVATDRLPAGAPLEIALGLRHNRLRSATVPFRLWIQDRKGRVVAHRTAEPRTWRHGDAGRTTLRWPLPAHLPPGGYLLVVGVEGMQQGIAWAERPFEIVAAGE